MTWTPLFATSIRNTRNVQNELDDTVYPQWVITGPGYYPTFTKNNTGEVLALAYEILRGETVTIDTDPTQKTVVSSVNGDISSYKTSASTFWALPMGSFSVSVDYGQTLPESKITLSLIPKAA